MINNEEDKKEQIEQWKYEVCLIGKRCDFKMSKK